MTIHGATEYSPVATTYGVESGDLVAALESRSVVGEHTAGSFDALFGPEAYGPLSLAERLAIACFSTQLQGSPLSDTYAAQLADVAGPEFAADVVTRDWPESVAGYMAYVEKLTLAPVAVTVDDVHDFVTAFGDDVLVIVSQIVSFVSYQLRVVAGLGAIAGTDADTSGDPFAVAPPHDIWTMENLEWTARATPLPGDDLTDVEARALKLTDIKSPYFRLLARAPEVLIERTLTDHAIFRLPDGLPRGERELGALVSSIVNGCVFCASVHSRFSAHYSKRPDDIERLLSVGLATTLDARWRAIVDMSAALAQPVPQVTAEHITTLRELGFDTLSLVDLVHSTAFFAWANRLMLSLGDPVYPDPKAA